LQAADAARPNTTAAVNNSFMVRACVVLVVAVVVLVDGYSRRAFDGRMMSERPGRAGFIPAGDADLLINL